MLVTPKWKRRDNTPMDQNSDGYGTGLVTFILQQAGYRGDARVKKAVGWLEKNQDPATGLWPSSSLNVKRDPESDRGRFMSDAATAYAVLALAGK
jgi:squalene-hopene/tetraprenyl-beta-curcumene cyclase